ncbi:hypothetical protein FJY71_00735 [candidate division WOR-3 bacterium]|nr:hypothetical protein [candidate division WOR-3 bacterium]
MKRAALGLALAGVALAAGPHFHLKAVQPLLDNLYGVMPRAGLGIRFPQSANFAFRTELAGSYGTGRGEFASCRAWSVLVRAGEEANASPLLDAHVGLGIMYAYARERRPFADTNGAITDRWGSGSAIALYGEAGVMIVRGRGYRLDFEAGLDIGAVQTDLPLESQYQPADYSWVSLTGLNAGFVFRLGEPSAREETQDPRRPCSGCLH